jgi:hypothetical protein
MEWDGIFFILQLLVVLPYRSYPMTTRQNTKKTDRHYHCEAETIQLREILDVGRNCHGATQGRDKAVRKMALTATPPSGSPTSRASRRAEEHPKESPLIPSDAKWVSPTAPALRHASAALQV